MKVKLIRRLGQHEPGAVVDYDDSIGTWLMSTGAAVAPEEQDDGPEPETDDDPPAPAEGAAPAEPGEAPRPAARRRRPARNTPSKP